MKGDSWHEVLGCAILSILEMSMKSLFWVLGMFVLGCKPAVTTPQAVPAQVDPAPVADKKDMPANQLDEACFKECLKNNQMRAVDIAQIERDCEASCGGEKMPSLPEPVEPTEPAEPAEPAEPK